MASSAPKSARVNSAQPPASAEGEDLTGENSSGGQGFKAKFSVPDSFWKNVSSALLGILLLAGIYYAWRQKTASEQAQTASEMADAPSPLDHVAPAADTSDVQLVNEKFAVKVYKAFPFVVPAHMIHPHVHGKFETVASGDTATTVDLMLMRAQDYQEFAAQRPSDAVSFQQGASSGMIDWVVPPTMVDEQKYYLVFVNSDEGSPTSVNADFTVSFE